MKKRMIFSLVISSLLILALGIRANISFNVDPVISASSPTEFTKYIDVVTGKENWSSRTAYVVVAASMDGLGEGQGTLKNVSLLNEGPYATYQDSPDYVGSKDNNGSWTAGTGANVGAAIRREVPDVKGSYSWSSGGEITLTPYVWKESISIGGQIRLPIGAAGTFSTTGTWANGTSTTRSASAKSGTHTVKYRYKCDACDRYGDTTAAIGGQSAHSVITCPGSNCSVRYHKCSPPSGHQVHEACGKRRCDGGDHSYVRVCTDGYSPGYSNALGCGKQVYKCTESAHRLVTWNCGHDTYACNKGNHGNETVSCPLGPNNQTCSYGSYYPCSPHTCAYSGSGSGNMGSNTGSSNTMLACGVHSTSESGDHSLQASCSTDSSCISTNFYLCSHSHSYPSTPTDNTPDCSYCTDGCSECQAPSPPPPPPSTTSCSAGHPYNPNNSSAVNRHRTRTCRFSECGQTWQACVNGSSAPLCNKPYRNQNGLSCWAQ